MGINNSYPVLDPSKTTLSFRNRNIKELPFQIPPNHPIESIDLSNNQIISLPYGLISLRIIDLSCNGVDFMSKKIVNSLVSYTGLIELKLSYNNIIYIPEEISSLKHLQVLNLNNNQIANINLSLPNLISLDLSCNKLSNFNCSFTSLKTLNLNFNYLKKVDFSSESLTHLTLSGNDITELCQTSVFPSLQVLNLSHNRISYLPPLIDIVPNLLQLSISNNLLQTIPVHLPKSLTAFAAPFNYLTSVGHEISELNGLSVLVLNNNFINEIPKLPSSIDYIRLDHNRIRRLHQLNNSVLKTLQVCCNDLSCIPAFSNTYINVLTIMNNPISEISIASLSQSLIRLDLSHCSIKSIPPALFSFTQLKYLILTNNQISEIPDSIEQSSLLSLVINENPIDHLPTLPPTLAMFFGCLCMFTEFPYSLCILPRLSIVNISCNKIAEIPSIPHVHTLIASCNQISVMPDVSDRIRTIDLSHNCITEASISWDLSQLLEIDLSHNCLEVISLTKANKLSSMKLSHNPNLVFEITPAMFPTLAFLDVLCTQINVVADEFGWLSLRELVSSSNIVPSLQCKKIDDCINIGYSEMKGNREQMEDAIIIRKSLFDNVDVFGVLDGHAGYYAATHSAYLLPEILANQGSFSCHSIAQCIEVLNEKIKQENIEDGSTLALVLQKGSSLICANIGDSRALIIKRDGSVFPLTYDHKPDERSELEGIRKRGSFVVDGRTSGVLAISRSLGDHLIKGVSAVPSMIEYCIDPEDYRVVIACDGVFDVITNEEVGKIVLNEEDVSKSAFLIRNVAFARMSQDNITVIVKNLSE